MAPTPALRHKPKPSKKTKPIAKTSKKASASSKKISAAAAPPKSSGKLSTKALLRRRLLRKEKITTSSQSSAKKRTLAKEVLSQFGLDIERSPLKRRAFRQGHKPLGECSHYLQHLQSVLGHYQALMQAMSPKAKIPQEPAWFLRNQELEELEPVLETLETVVNAPTLENNHLGNLEHMLEPLGRLVGAPVQVIPHIQQLQALHILLHLGEHPDLPVQLLFPLTQALHHVANDEEILEKTNPAHARTHRLMERAGKKSAKGLAKHLVAGKN